MYSVIIVDDEPVIRAGLRSLVRWEQYGFVIAGDAMNGREALACHQEIRPDLMIIDIRMPGMSGLEVIAEIRQTDPHCHFLILSGYADFNYAKSAIRQGVIGYLLKPVDEDELIGFLQQIQASLLKQSRASYGEAINDDMRREQYIVSLLLPKSTALNQELPPGFAEWIGTDRQSYQILLIEHPWKGMANSRLLGKVKERLTRAFAVNHRGIVFTMDACLGILLKKVIAKKEQRHALIAEIEEAISEQDFVIEAALGKVVPYLADIHASYAEAALLLQYRFLFGGESVMTNHDSQLWECVKEQRAEQLQPDLTVIINRLYYALEMGNKTELAHWIDQAGLEMSAFDGSESYLRKGFSQIISTILNKLSGIDQQTYGTVQNYMPLMTELYDQPNFTAMKQWINTRLSALASQLSNTSSQSVLKQMVDFIERHYHENLKLETLADIFNYNSGYLGKIFKLHTGLQFHTYLDKVRIGKAIELLGEGVKVHQVAVRVGYANVDYFHSKFKKYIGESPSSYKGKKSNKS